jgi:hypothetical protein
LEREISKALVSDTFGTRNAGQEPLEELVEIQALSLDLREAVMACLSGRESRRWTVLELVERFKNLGAVAPLRTRDRMDPGAHISALRASFWRQRVPLKEAKIL